MKFIPPNNATPALVRQFNDDRPLNIRILHWLYRLASERRRAKVPSSHIIDNIHQWKKKFQCKTSLNLQSDSLTQERRGE